MDPLFDFTDEQIFSNPRGHLLALEIELARGCGSSCGFSAPSSIPEPETEAGLSGGEIEAVITQARELGAKKIVLSGSEKISRSGLSEITETIRAQGMEAVFPQKKTNGPQQDCFRHRYFCLVKHNGDVHPCAGIAESIGNVRLKRLADILNDSIILDKLYHWKEWIKKPCRSCEKNDRCCGCRGTAWHYTRSDYLAADPACPRNAGKLDGITILPARTDALIPHRPPVAVSGKIEHITNRGGIYRTVIPPDWTMLSEDGILPPETICELASQAIAAFHSLTRDGVVLNGMLAGINRFKSYKTVRTGESVTVEFETVSDFIPWHIMSFKLKTADGITAADGELKLCAPEE